MEIQKDFLAIFLSRIKESSAFGKSHKQAETNAAKLIEKFINIGKIKFYNISKLGS